MDSVDVLPLCGTGSYWVYILTNQRHTVLYIGITNGLERRLWQHSGSEQIKRSSFTYRYNLDKLIYFESYPDARQAIAREKQIKRWTRAKKEQLIAMVNPEWRDLGAKLFGD